MNTLKIFNNQNFGQVRTIERNGEPWFVGKDIAEKLGYINPRKALADHVDTEDKSNGVTIRDTIGRNQNPTIINESGLYSLVLSSKLPNAKEFKRWITSEVIPAIRKHGGYLSPEKVEQVLTDPDTIIKLATNLKKEREARLEAEAKLVEAQPKVIFADAVSASSKTILIGDLAKLLRQNGHEMGQKRLFQGLRDNGYLIRRMGAEYNSPTQRAMEMGLFEIKETAITHAAGNVTISKTTKVTGKGQIYFINLFAKKGAAK